MDNSHLTSQHLARWSSLAILHGLGFSLLFAISALLLLPPESLRALSDAFLQGHLSLLRREVLFHAAMSLASWTLLVILFRLLKRQRPPRLIHARGTVITETLIVLPVFLVLNMGMIQLALINTAGLLTSLASANAARAIAVWHPESMSSRSSVSPELVLEKAHVAASAVLAPVSPSSYTFDSSTCESNTSRAMIRALARIGHTGDNDSIAYADGSPTNRSVARTFDVTGMQDRGQRKLLFALCATAVNYQTDPSNQEIYAVVEYQQQMIVPFVAKIFGSTSPNPPGNRPGSYLLIARDATSFYQIPPSARTP